VTKGLIIFAREPVPGRVKTRLGRTVGNHAAAELYRAMMTDVLEQATLLPEVRPFLFWSLVGIDLPDSPDLSAMEAHRQQGADLGQRMANAFELAFEHGCTACCIIGTDSPDLPTEYIRQAFDLLCRNEAEVAFGPAEDGGYYLLGMCQAQSGLFDDIAWGTSQVLAASLERARKLGLRIALLPPWYDIDTQDDLLRLLDSPGMNAPRTREAAVRLLKDVQAAPDQPNLSSQGNSP